MDRFDKKDDDDHPKYLTMVRYKGYMEDNMVELQCIAVMVHSVSEKRVIFPFYEGLMEPLRVMVKAFLPKLFQDVIKRKLDLEPKM